MDKDAMVALNAAFDKIMLNDEFLKSVQESIKKWKLMLEKNTDAKHINMTNKNSTVSLKDFLFKQIDLGAIDLTMSNNWIVIDNNFSSTSEESIPFQITEQGDFYLNLKLNSEGYIRVFINNDSRIPAGRVYYDYFGSGEMYVNIPEGITLLNANAALRIMLNAYFFDENASLKHFIPEELDKTYKPFITSCSNPVSGSVAWSFDLEHFFHTATYETSSQIEVSPICKYYSFVDDDTSIISPEYSYANHILGHQSCSCPERNVKVNTVQLCDVPKTYQSKCAFYKPLSNSVIKVSISPKNSNQAIDFEMTHSPAFDGQNIFTITNLTDKVLINKIQAPADISLEAATKEAHSIFDEYISCYTEHSIEPQQETVSPEKKSFIKTLIEA